MNDRRRNIIVLTTVVALLIGSLVVIFTKPTKLGLDLQGGVQLVYEARPTKQQPTINQESLDRALDIMRDRVDSLGVAEPELQRSGSRPDRGQPPGRQERGARRRPGRHHGPDVLLRLGTEHPRRGLQDEPGGGQRRPAADLRALQRGQAGVEVPAGDRRQQHHQRALVRVRQEVARADQRRDPGRDEGRARGGPAVAEPHRQGRDPRGAGGDHRPPRRRRPRPGGQARPARPVVGAEGQPGPRRHRHQEPRAELRGRVGRSADRHDGVLRQGPQGVRRTPPARSPSAAPTTRRSTAACRTRSTPRTTSRSGSTTR